MDNPTPNPIEPEPGSQPEDQPIEQVEAQLEEQANPETASNGYVNEKISRAYDRAKYWFGATRDNYRKSTGLQKVTYQGKFLPAFWTVACIFSLMVNIILIALLVSFGRHFFELKAVVSEGLVNGLYSNLELMDKSHIVKNVPFEATVAVKDTLPVVFNLPINQDTQVSLVQDTDVKATTLINLAPVPLEFTLPAGTPLQVNLDMTIPVSQSIPVEVTVPVSLQVPLDLAIDQTDLHQSIVGMQSTIEPYKELMGKSFNSTADISFCNHWWSGWLCTAIFGKP